MDEFWGVTILLFIILAVFFATLLRLTAYHSKFHRVRHPRVRMTDRAASLKSGDIILFVAHTHGLTNSIFTSTLYSHGGVVVEDEKGQLLISESTSGSSSPDPVTGEEVSLPSAAQVGPLAPRLRNYSGMMFLMPLKKPLSPEQVRVLRERAKETAPYPGFFHMILAAFRIPYGREIRHCMQHVAWLLDEVGLTPVAKVAQGETLLGTGFFGAPEAVIALPQQPLGDVGDNAYGEILELLFDVDC